jgi:Protein of unknown function (DUF4238)
MSGKRQHFVPQFLQNGFVSHSNGDEAFTWVYRKNSKPFNANIINVGVEGYFYSQDGDNQVDDEITNLETRFAALVNSLRAGNTEAISNTEAIAEMISHFEIRTRHLRQSASIAIAYGLEKMLEIVEDPHAFSAFLNRRMPAYIKERMSENQKNHNFSNLMVETLIIGLRPMWEEKISSLINETPLLYMTNKARVEIPKMLKDSLKSGHIDGLKNSAAPKIKVDLYKKMKFSVVKKHKNYFPFGDSIIIFELDGERAFKAICDKDDLIKAVYLPLASDLILVGQFTSENPNLLHIPMAIAQCSLEYFISSTKNNTNQNFQTHIGEYAHLLSKEQIDTTLMNIINE